MPVEVKEKYPVIKPKERYFGIDAGRLLMFLRLCIPNDSNAIFIVREIEKDRRKLKGWKFITLSKIIMACGWTLLKGGKGMTGRDTSTVIIPYDEFEELTEAFFEEENLRRISNLPNDVKAFAFQYRDKIEARLSPKQF